MGVSFERRSRKAYCSDGAHRRYGIRLARPRSARDDNEESGIRSHRFPRAAAISTAKRLLKGGTQGRRQIRIKLELDVMCEADCGLDRVIDWVCCPPGPELPCRFAAEELLECLCDILLPIPLDERDVLDALTPPADELPTIETQIFQAFSAIFGQVVPCSVFVDADAIVAEFAARWPEQAGRLRDQLHERIARTRANIENLRAGSINGSPPCRMRRNTPCRFLLRWPKGQRSIPPPSFSTPKSLASVSRSTCGVLPVTWENKCGRLWRRTATCAGNCTPAAASSYCSESPVHRARTVSRFVSPPGRHWMRPRPRSCVIC